MTKETTASQRAAVEGVPGLKGRTTIPAQVRALSSEWPTPEKAWLEAFVEAIRHDYAHVVRRALLFGSKARGDWHAESDIDILVIISDEAKASGEAIEALSDELPGAPESLPVVLTHTESEWTELGEWKADFHQVVEREGVSVL